MTSNDRREARYQRRKAKREAKTQEVLAKHGEFDKVFKFGNLYRCYKLCRRNVGWKPSVKRFIACAPSNVYDLYRKLKTGSYKSSGFCTFYVHERGKTRLIRSVKISERIVQKCDNRYCLTPILSRSFIYRNCASLQGKGQTFTMDGIKAALRHHVRLYGTEGFILTYDFKGYFDNIDHAVIFSILKRAIEDERILSLNRHFIDCFGDKGLGLGSECSQILALATANEIDHAFKERLRIKAYTRYMDDGWCLVPQKETAETALEILYELCGKLRIKTNADKTVIRQLRRGFRFMKIRTRVHANAKVTQRLPEKNPRLERTRLRKLHKYVDRGLISLSDVWQGFQSWRSYALRFKARRQINDMKAFLIQKYPTIMKRS